MRSTPAALIALALGLTFAGPSMAKPTDPGILPDLQPVVLGQVTSTNSHTVTVVTGEGETMPFEFDSRTVMPMNMETGTRVRVEFHHLENGMHLARRITPIE